MGTTHQKASTEGDSLATRTGAQPEPFAAFCAAGLWPGVGRGLAARLAEAGVKRPDDVTPERLADIRGVGRERAERLMASFERAIPAYDLAELFVATGVPPRLAGPARTALGDGAAGELRVDPWGLLVVPGVRPDQADHFAGRALSSPVNPADPRRGRALVCYLLTRAARDGHTVRPAATLARALRPHAIDEPLEAIEAALDNGSAVTFESDENGEEEPRTLLGSARLAMAEESLAEGLVRLSATAESLGEPGDTAAAEEALDDTQREAVAAVAEHGVSVLTGGPGTGKSRAVAAVVALAHSDEKRVALAAPTGRAAKRLEELTGAEATTLHRLLGARGAGGGFARGEGWPLDADVVVVDEASMLDVELGAALVEACADGTHLLLVGDPAQLPSIGPGRVLGDVLASGTVPVTELRTLYRQEEGGAIAGLAAAVRGGELPRVDAADREVVVVPARDGGEAAHRTVQLVTDSIPRVLSVPAEEIQVVTPIHRGPAGTLALNAALKRVLNPGEGAYSGFDIGDRVVAVANHTDDGFANGEVGVVTGTADDGLTVSFAGGPVTVPRQLIGDLRHGWAVTVHRAQGSEWPAVVAVVPGEAAGMLSKPLVYTAFTRARRHLSVVHAAGPALARAVRTVGERPRRTRLTELLRAGG